MQQLPPSKPSQLSPDFSMSFPPSSSGRSAKSWSSFGNECHAVAGSCSGALSVTLTRQTATWRPGWPPSISSIPGFQRNRCIFEGWNIWFQWLVLILGLRISRNDNDVLWEMVMMTGKEFQLYIDASMTDGHVKSHLNVSNTLTERWLIHYIPTYRLNSLENTTTSTFARRKRNLQGLKESGTKKTHFPQRFPRRSLDKKQPEKPLWKQGWECHNAHEFFQIFTLKHLLSEWRMMYNYMLLDILWHIPISSKGVKFHPPGLFLVLKGLKFQTLGGFRYMSICIS